MRETAEPGLSALARRDYPMSNRAQTVTRVTRGRGASIRLGRESGRDFICSECVIGLEAAEKQLAPDFAASR